MYLVAFTVAYLLIRHRLKNEKKYKDFSINMIQDLFLWLVLGVIVGGRLGYVFFYNLGYYLQNPIEIIIPFSGGEFTGIAGMSFHGGLIGAVLVGIIFCRLKKISFMKVSDLIIPTVPLGFMFGRIGNFLNGELWGRMTESSIGMYFPRDPSGALRYPSQLLQALLEGLALFVLLWAIRKKDLPAGSFLGIYLIGYAVARIVSELFREPDAHLGFIFASVTMGQILSAIMVIVGVGLLVWANGARDRTSA